MIRTLALALAGCHTGADVYVTEQHQQPATEEDASTYVVEVDTPTEPGQHLVEARASCEDGDSIVSGGCSWGTVVDPHDPPLRAVEDRPDDAGAAWLCVGQNTGVGASLKTLTASAICLVR
jgi:hypothetical protein